MKKYRVGMYGGKFMPLHKGHFHCLETAANECEKVYFICFINGIQEKEIIHNNKFNGDLSVNSRLIQMYRAAYALKDTADIVVQIIDVSGCITEDGLEDWDAETPLVRAVCGQQIDAVYGSEEAYSDYFKRAYPECVYRVVDSDRKEFPISATMIRNMNNKKEISKWII